MFAEVMRSQFHGIMKNQAKDLRGDERWFGEIAVVYTWSGKIESFKKARDFLKMINRGVHNYFTSWKYSLEIKFHDQEET